MTASEGELNGKQVRRNYSASVSLLGVMYDESHSYSIVILTFLLPLPLKYP